MTMLHTAIRIFLVLVLMLAGTARADVPWTFSDNTRYMALGDSLAAGYGAIPTTQGYAYLLYQQGVYDQVTNTLFANAAVPGATSGDVLAYQVPQAITRFEPTVVTLSVGGNDLLSILGGPPDPDRAAQIIGQFQENLGRILCGLSQALPRSRIYVHNLYDIPEITSIVPGALDALHAFNAVIGGVARGCGAVVADVYSAFSGRTGLLLIARNGAGQFEVHPTNAGYRAIADAFSAVHQ
jgi:lysophospholipase L1-like esterase